MMPRMTKNRTLLLLVFFAAILLFEKPGTFLFESDEARYAEIPREMIASQDYITPRQNGSKYFEKPPLLYWMTALSFKIFGENDYAARLPVRLAALGTVLVMLFCAQPLMGITTSLWAALFYISSMLGFSLSRTLLTDGPLTFSLTLTFFLLRKFLIQRIERQPARLTSVFLGLALALAMLSKGLIGLVFPLALFIAMVFFTHQWHLIKDVFFSWIFPIFFLVSVPWFISVQLKNPEFSWFFFIHEHVLRYLTPEASRPGPFYYFLGVFFLGFFPWTFFFWAPLKKTIITCKDLMRRRVVAPAWNEIHDTVFFGFWFIFILLFFSTSNSKLIPYILPLLPAASFMLAREITANKEMPQHPFLINALFWSVVVPIAFTYGISQQLIRKFSLWDTLLIMSLLFLAGSWSGYFISKKNKEQGLQVLALAWGGIYLMIMLALPRIASDYCTRALAPLAEKTKPDQIVTYRCYPHSLPWVLKRTVPVVEYQGELASVGALDQQLFWKEEYFWARWNSAEHLVVFAKDNSQKDVFFSNNLKPAHILGKNRKYLVIANFQ